MLTIDNISLAIIETAVIRAINMSNAFHRAGIGVKVKGTRNSIVKVRVRM